MSTKKNNFPFCLQNCFSVTVELSTFMYFFFIIIIIIIIIFIIIIITRFCF